MWSDKAVFAAHYWETTSFLGEDDGGDADAGFKRTVIKPLKGGLKLKGKTLQDDLNANKDLFKNAKAIIFTPRKNKLNDDLEFGDKVSPLKAELLKIVPTAAIDIQKYTGRDTGKYNEDVDEKLLAPKAKSKLTRSRANKKGEVTFRELVNELSFEESDGYMMFQFDKTKGVQVLLEQKRYSRMTTEQLKKLGAGKKVPLI